MKQMNAMQRGLVRAKVSRNWNNSWRIKPTYTERERLQFYLSRMDTLVFRLFNDGTNTSEKATPISKAQTLQIPRLLGV